MAVEGRRTAIRGRGKTNCATARRPLQETPQDEISPYPSPQSPPHRTPPRSLFPSLPRPARRWIEVGSAQKHRGSRLLGGGEPKQVVTFHHGSCQSSPADDLAAAHATNNEYRPQKPALLVEIFGFSSSSHKCSRRSSNRQRRTTSTHRRRPETFDALLPVCTKRHRPPEPAKSAPRALFPLRNTPHRTPPARSRSRLAPPPPHYSRDCPVRRRERPRPTHSAPTNQPRGGHGEVHAQEQGLGRGGRHGGWRRPARRPHALTHPDAAAAGLLAAQGPRRHRGRGLPRAQEQEAREAAAAAAAGPQGEGRAGQRRRREEGPRRRHRLEGTGGGVRSGRGRPRGLLRGQCPGLGRHREEYQGDDALQPDQELGDDKHPWLGNQSQQPFPSQDDGDAGLPLRSQLSRDGRVLRRRRTTATSELQREVQLLPRDGLPAPRTLRVGEDRLLGSSPSSFRGAALY